MYTQHFTNESAELSKDRWKQSKHDLTITNYSLLL